MMLSTAHVHHVLATCWELPFMPYVHFCVLTSVRFDIYRKVPKDLTQPTYTGAIISICCCLFILFLFLSELTGFITTEVVNELYVDDPDKDSGGKIDVSLNISLPNLHCELVGLDIQDEMGRHEVGHIDNSMKIPLNNGAGCRFEGQFSINKNQELQILSQVGERSALGRAEAPGGSWQGFAQHVPALLEARYCHSGASQQRCEAAPFDSSHEENDEENESWRPLKLQRQPCLKTEDEAEDAQMNRRTRTPSLWAPRPQGDATTWAEKIYMPQMVIKKGSCLFKHLE
ncbi:endoplasmic reticulum-Golgi intermediate compartment protein 1 isoform X5 [Theropithecus gelada]|uniref:endoplasmic reticulum-Golgi intermediate compartment protein 1 isoform X5 n=1 Tax=Theropithecus gelada TaxID=9565 RepID=UPI000DC1977B|nr:endoplasmic reticulum-Golgi intermediate compartment protein 1 isoform X5 [Theropithecus gelada]